MQVKRLVEKPIIYPELNPTIGHNINGPSLIRVPDWLPDPLGKYYLYFAHHQGKFIRLAYADKLEGPWQIYEPGTLQLPETPCHHHIASPDIHIDHENKIIRMFYHGPCYILEGKTQQSFVAESTDGIHFDSYDAVLGDFYFRVFEHQGDSYAIAKKSDAPGDGVLYKADNGIYQPFTCGNTIIKDMRHCALYKTGNLMHIFYSRGWDCPERILHATMPMEKDWTQWTPSVPTTVISPDRPWEGGNLPQARSEFGAIHRPVRQLRDPAIFDEDGHLYLLYSCAGECSIAIAEINF